MQYRVVLEFDGIYRSCEPVGGFEPKAERGDQVFVVDAEDRREAIAKAGDLWRLEEPMAAKKKTKKKRKKKAAPVGY